MRASTAARTLLQRSFALNRHLSAWFDEQFLPEQATVDGMQYFLEIELPRSLRDGETVIDLGSGKMPAIPPHLKRMRRLHVIGVDIDPVELDAAPAGAYDETIVADITQWRGRASADLAVCSAVLEHVTDTAAAFEAIASSLKPGGRALIFCPCRNALFARLNLALPQSTKRALLDLLHAGHHSAGFPAFYDRCTPEAFSAMADRAGLSVERVEPFFMSAYFSVFVPAHLAWRAYQVIAQGLVGNAACETFMMVAIKR